MTDKDKALRLIELQNDFLQEMEKKANTANTKLCNVLIVAKLRWKLFASDSYKLSDELKEEIEKIASILEDSDVAVECAKKMYGNISDVILSTLNEKGVAISLELQKIIKDLFLFKCFYFKGKIFSCPRKSIDIRGKLF